MAPDRPDASDVDSGGAATAEPAIARVFGFCESFTADRSGTSEEQIVEEEIPMVKSECRNPDDKITSDDELTSLSWLHQQNLLKGLDITEQQQQQQNQQNQQQMVQDDLIKEESVSSNLICEDSLDASENTNSISSIEDNYFYESNGKATGSTPVLHYHDVVSANNGQTSPNNTQDFINGLTQVSPTKNNYNNNNNSNSNANFNLPVPNRNKHPTHIPYDPYLHKNSKPPYSFSCLIFMAIEDSPGKALPVKEVYAWILEHFPYFRNAPTGWKNSVRHNLSLNKCFRKVEKSPNLGKGSLWMVDAQYRPNLMQALQRSPFPPATTPNNNLPTPEKIVRKPVNNGRLPDPILFPYLSKRLASSNIEENTEAEFDSDVDAAAAAMLSFKHGPIILNHNKDRKKKQETKMVPVITRSSTEDHTYSLITSVRLERHNENVENEDFDEQRKIAEGADALLNLAGVCTSLARDHYSVETDEEEESYGHTLHHYISENDKLELVQQPKRRLSNDGSKRRKRPWRDAFTENVRYMKQVRG